MFSKTIKENVIPPNFLNSILSNPSLYAMFKNEFEENREYFQNIEKEEYLSAMIDFLEDSLFSSNMFHIYNEIEDLENYAPASISYIKAFYDDFLLEEFKKDSSSILKTKFFRGLEYARTKDIYACRIKAFNELYDYVFHESLDYADIVRVLTKDAISKLKSGEVLSLKDFDILCFYVKNNIAGFIDMDIVTKMLKNHAYKHNHIFDREVVEEIISSTLKSYLDSFGVKAHVVFKNGLDDGLKSSHDYESSTIYIDYSLVDGFISLNYIELFEYAFLEAELVLNHALLAKNECTYSTLKVIMKLVVQKVDIERLFEDKNYRPIAFFQDLKASSFIKALRFFSSFGVNLFNNFIESKLKDMSFEMDEASSVSKKELVLDQQFFVLFDSYPKKQELIKKYDVLSLLYNAKGERIRTIDLVKKLSRNEHVSFLEEYLDSRIIDPESMIDDVIDLSGYRPKDEFTKNFIEKQLKYIYVDSFFYSLDSFIKMNRGKNFDVEEFLDDLSIRINCIKDTPFTHKFIDEALFTISDMKENIS